MEVLHYLRQGNRAIVTRSHALVAWVVFALACGGEHARDWGREDTAAMIADSVAALDTAPAPLGGMPDEPDELTTSPDEIVLAADSAAGDHVFHRRGQCFTCHGAAGEGMDRLGPSLRRSVWLHSDGSIAGIQRTIAMGVASPQIAPIAMPGFSRQLSSEELRQVAAYVYTLGRGGTVLEEGLDEDP